MAYHTAVLPGSGRLEGFERPAAQAKRVHDWGTMRVFISSTIEDLEIYRAKAEEAVLRAGCTPTLLKYWGPSGRPPLSECLCRVAEGDLLVVIVAYRYGWRPGSVALNPRRLLKAPVAVHLLPSAVGNRIFALRAVLRKSGSRQRWSLDVCGRGAPWSAAA